MAVRRLLWRQDIRGSYGRFSDSDMAPLVVDGRIFISVYRQGLYALSLDMGAVLWKRPWSSQSDFLYHDGQLYLSTVDGEVQSANPATGETLWKAKLADGATILTNPVVWGDRLVVGERSKGLYILDRGSGKILGRHGISGGTSAPLLSAGDNDGQKSLYFLSNAHQLYSLAPGS
jgi:outer membrane protein assembly factor BamB